MKTLKMPNDVLKNVIEVYLHSLSIINNNQSIQSMKFDKTKNPKLIMEIK